MMLSSFALATNLYQQDSLQLQLNVEGEFDLVPRTSSASAREVSVDLLLYPKSDYRQNILTISQEAENNILKYSWKNPDLGVHFFDYEATISTNNNRMEVRRKIPYPPMDIKGYEQYTLPTAKIDSDNPDVIAQAARLAEGEDDLFKAVFNLASWVSENINYDLNELTTNSAQKASWVLKNKQGVCDEMTSLFVAMARSLGIPAKFVSGISYTENADVLAVVGNNWAGHGWAEVYFPEIGWVSFDITFDEYGYIDVTHLKLREGFDPDEPATKYQWLADQVDLQAKGLDIDVVLQQRGAFVPEAVQLEMELLASEVDFGSYNLVKGVLKNNADYYAATTLNLAAPDDVQIVGQNKRKILLSPREVRETYWIIKVPTTLKEDYWYEFPLIVYTEKNVSVQEVLKSQKGKSFFSQEEIEKFTIEDEEKSYSRKVSFDCNYPREIKVDEEAVISCSVKNSGNMDLDDVRFCLDKVCEMADLPINQELLQELTVKETTAGWHHLQVSAENEDIEKRTSLNFLVVDPPQMEIQADSPDYVIFGENIPFTITLEKKSFQVPQDIVVTLEGLGAEQMWELEQLNNMQQLTTTFPGDRLQRRNVFTVKAVWKDQAQPLEQVIIVNGKAQTFSDIIKMSFNRILNFFIVEEND